MVFLLPKEIKNVFDAKKSPSDINNDWSLSLEPPVVLTIEDLGLPVSSFTSAGMHVLVCVVLNFIRFACASGQCVVNYIN